MVNHTEYDPDFWNWCPNPQLRMELIAEGKDIFEELAKDLEEATGHVPFAGGEWSESDLICALALYKRKLDERVR